MVNIPTRHIAAPSPRDPNRTNDTALTTTETWRQKYRVHPAADLFPMLPDAELDELGADIKQNGLREPLVIWRDLATDEDFLVDGRNRLAAMARAGVSTTPASRMVTSAECPDPSVLAGSLNIFRRHLAPAERANLVAKLLRRQPEVSKDVLRNPHGGRPKSMAGQVAELAKVSKPVALEQVAVAADPALQAQVDAGVVSAKGAGRTVRERSHKKKAPAPVAAVPKAQDTRDADTETDVVVPAVEDRNVGAQVADETIEATGRVNLTVDSNATTPIDDVDFDVDVHVLLAETKRTIRAAFKSCPPELCGRLLADLSEYLQRCIRSHMRSLTAKKREELDARLRDRYARRAARFSSVPEVPENDDAKPRELDTVKAVEPTIPHAAIADGADVQDETRALCGNAKGEHIGAKCDCPLSKAVKPGSRFTTESIG